MLIFGEMVQVLLRGVEAERFLSFGDRVRLDMGPGLTVVTGPNGAGKTDLGLPLDLARAVIGRAASDPAAVRLGLYESAGYEGAGSFMVALHVELDQQWERERLWAFVCAGYACATRGEPGEPSADENDAIVREWLVKDSLAPLWSGRLIVRYESTMMRPWFAAWEFSHVGETWYVGLVGSGSGQLRRGLADPWEQSTGSVSLKDWLLASKPQDKSLLDFRVALEGMSQSVTFSVQSLTGGSGVVPASLREMAPGLSAAEYGNRGFPFEYLLSTMLQRGLVLTDNRRLPLKSQFTYEELRQSVDLRDGAGVAAELDRLKTGDVRERERFGHIQATFKGLTGRVLDVRSRHAPEGQDPGMIIEPVVVDGRGERPVVFSGAGVQEAVLLSTLLDDEPGKIVVLDEPAVNLEPTVQRRLLRRLRGPGQRLVITHHPDLVPVEEPADLGRVVRIAPGRSGSQVLRPDLGNFAAGEARRWLRLLEPAHVRALLFAPAVILCEGATEVAALPRWWRHVGKIGLRDPEAANIPVISVDSDSRFGMYVRYLDTFGVRWAIVADGPALRGHSKLARQLAGLGHAPGQVPGDEDDFTGWRECWESVGVFTLAGEFGDDGGKGGEFEAFLRQEDAGLLARIEAEVGRNAKPVVGSYFAGEHPEPPGAVLDLYAKIAAWFGPSIVAQENNGTAG